MNEEIIQAIWKHGTGEFCWLAAIDRLNDNRFTHWTVNKEDFRLEQPYGHDIFFAPLPTQVGKRGNDHVVRPAVLFVDADEGADLSCMPEATACWWTSPGNKQAVWFLDKPFIGYAFWAGLNQAVTKATKSDPGGWMGSKLLRVPDSVNWKRREFGKVAWWDEEYVYAAEDIAKRIGYTFSTEQTVSNGSVWPEPRQDVFWSFSVRQEWDRLSLRSRAALAKETNDRSLHIVRTIYLLKEDGFSSEEVFHLLWHAPFNKWRTDRYDPGRLWQEIEAVGG